MKILFVSGNLTDGGAQRVIAVVSSKLADLGHDVELFLFARNKKEYPISEKVKVTSIADNFSEYKKISSIKRMFILRRFLKKERPDVAIGFLEGGYALYLASFGLKIKKIASMRIDPKKYWQIKGFRTKIKKFWFSSADSIVVQTTSQIENMPKKMRRKCVVIANPISDKALDAVTIEKTDTCRKFVMAGRIEKQKNYEMAISALKMLIDKYPDISLDIYGKGSQAEDINSLIMENGLSDNIKLCGWTDDTVNTYINYDAYLLTSNYEGMPNALMEAMAVGLPSISTDCPTGPSELITDGNNGFLVPLGDAEALAQRMEMLMNMPKSERALIGSSAKNTMKEKFNSDVISKAWLKLFEDLKK